jgi:hypothetical protein
MGGASGGSQSTGDAVDSSENIAADTQSITVHDQATDADAEGSGVVGGEMEHEQMEVDDTIDQDDGPVRFRSLNDVYQDSKEVELASDAEIEALLALMEEPAKFHEAAGNPNWMAAMDSEIQSINKNKTWHLVKLPAGHKPIGLKWVYKLKKNAEGEVVKHKARLVAKGYVQKEGIDFEEVFAPVARLDTVRLPLAMAANWGWQAHHLDVKTTFLNGDLTEDVYVTQPKGYVVKGKEHLVLKLSKALYGLKQAPRAWNVKLDGCLKELSFRKCVTEPAVYTRGVGQSKVIIGVYVDDLIVTGGDLAEIVAFKKQMTSQFDMSDLDMLSFYLGLEVEQQKDYIAIRQTSYAKCWYQ